MYSVKQVKRGGRSVLDSLFAILTSRCSASQIRKTLVLVSEGLYAGFYSISKSMKLICGKDNLTGECFITLKIKSIDLPNQASSCHVPLINHIPLIDLIPSINDLESYWKGF